MSTAEPATFDRGRGLRERGRIWVGHLEKIEAEGIAAKDYAAREGLSVRALYQAKKRLVKQGAWPRKRGSAEPTFARVRFLETAPPPSAAWAVRLRVPSGAMLEWSAQPGADLLAAILTQVSPAR